MNRERRWQGQANPPLSSEGLAQASALAEQLASRAAAEAPIEALFASDLERAARTAGVVGQVLGLEPRLLVGLRERDVGAWSGLRHPEIEARWPDELRAFRAGDVDVRPGGGECQREFAARVKAAFDEVQHAAPAHRVAVVTHLGVLRVWRPGIRLGNTEHFWLDPAEGAELRTDAAFSVGDAAL